MNENNLQNNQSLNNISNQNPQPVNNTNQTMNTQTNLSEVNHNTQVNSTNPTTTQTNPSSVNPTVTQASPSSVNPTATQTNPSTVSPTTTQTSPSPVSSTTTQTSPNTVSPTATQTSPNPVSPTATQTSPSPVSSTTTQTSPTPVSQPTTSANINQTSSQPTNNQQELNLVNPLNPDEIVKKEILIEKEAPKENEEVNNNEENNQKPKKKKINPILLILLVVVIAAIGVIVYFTFFNNSEPDTPNTPQNPDTPETPVTPQITLNDILNNFNSNENVNQLRETSEITANINNNNEIAIDVTTDGQTDSYLFTLENRDLLFEIDSNDLTSNLLFLIICDNIGQFHGLDVNEVYSYLAAIDLNTTAVNGITLTQLENGNYQARINIDTKIDTSSLNTMYIEVSDLESYRDFLEGTGTVQIPKGNLMLYKEGDENTTTILIGEKDNLTSLTYNSILSVIELLYPDELENFKTSYPNLETIAFDRYTITTNPVLTGTLETLYNQYQNEYEFVLLEINKSL